MARTRRSIIRTVSATTATIVGAGTAAAADEDRSSDGDGTSAETDSVEFSQIRTTASQCGNQDIDESEVRRQRSLVSFSGATSSPTPCYRAVLESTHVEDETLVVTVGLEPEDSDGCYFCIGSVEYSGVLVLSDPGEIEDVDVRHAEPSL
ncbi:hypothetical protein CP556_04885 [Natrinema sp. CBA1119]|uniref:hypothetical protein n=1 Tax=Natrinema sp. CBA1119 TaxID=1608465 RepID=UPI000BF897A4|nr:hypothetical protein [Natrinema sp. CBA1119]PGF15519.1 hypothetical protein CP556_04885 [Natrinema sp. CBA1119]